MTAPPAPAPGRMPGAREEPAAPRPIRVLIVDDSAVARAVLSRVVAADRDFEVVAQASHAEEALALLATTRVDLVTLDVEMPGTDGLTALPAILRQGRGARVLIVSSIAEQGAAAAVQALALGADDTLPKPGGGRPHGSFAQLLISKMRTIACARRDDEFREHRLPALIEARNSRMRLRPMSAQPIRCLAVGASTGGLHALGELLGRLPERLGVPILVTQHLPAVFMPFFARQISSLTGRDAQVAQDGDALVAERILIAPGDAHLCLAAHAPRVRLDRSGTSGGCLPSVDPMFSSVAGQFGAGACAVVLTGMGRDGLAGSTAVVQAGGSVLVQDQASSAVWGMPRSVAEAGLACAVLNPAAIAARIGFAVKDSGAWT